MRLRLAVPAALVGLAAATLPATASGSASSPARIEHRTASTVRGDLGAALGAPSTWALRALDRHFDVSGARVEHVRESIVGTHVRGREYRGGVPVEGSDWLVSAVSGRIVQVEAHAVRLPGAPVATPVGEVMARAAALGRLKVRSLLAPTAVTRVLTPRVDRLVDVYRVSIVAAMPASASVVEVDAATGRVLTVSDDARYSDGSAMVFDPNPIVTKRDKALREPGDPGTILPVTPDPDLDSAELTAQRKKLPLRGLEAGALQQGRLS